MVIAQSLVAGTFGAYTLRLFPKEYAGYASILGVLLISIAYIVNVSGNKIIETTATFTAIIKVAGIALLAIYGLVISGLLAISGDYISSNNQVLPEGFGFSNGYCHSMGSCSVFKKRSEG